MVIENLDFLHKFFHSQKPHRHKKKRQAAHSSLPIRRAKAVYGYKKEFSIYIEGRARFLLSFMMSRLNLGESRRNSFMVLGWTSEKRESLRWVGKASSPISIISACVELHVRYPWRSVMESMAC